MKYMLIGAIIVVGIGSFIVYSSMNNGDTNMPDTHADTVESFEISPGEVVRKIESKEDIVLLDVRTPEEYAEVHLENAVLLPVQELTQETLAEVGLGEDMKNREIIMYCRSGARSKTAYDIMAELGYTNIKSVAGGMIHWEEDAYPFTETGEYKGERISSASLAPQTSGPHIDFDRVTHDFGVIPQYGGVVETTFTVKNTGTEHLEIGDIATSCGCTTAQISSQTIAAGKEAILTVRFDPNLHEEPEGVFKRTVFIPTNDPAVSESEVTIQVDIQEGA